MGEAVRECSQYFECARWVSGISDGDGKGQAGMAIIGTECHHLGQITYGIGRTTLRQGSIDLFTQCLKIYRHTQSVCVPEAKIKGE